MNITQSFDTHSAQGCASQTPMKLAPGWALIQINFDSIQEIEPKVGGGRSVVNGPCETMVHTTLENGILRNGQQSGSAVYSFIDLKV